MYHGSTWSTIRIGQRDLESCVWMLGPTIITTAYILIPHHYILSIKTQGYYKAPFTRGF